jgi:hypothetical protein
LTKVVLWGTPSGWSILQSLAARHQLTVDKTEIDPGAYLHHLQLGDLSLNAGESLEHSPNWAQNHARVLVGVDLLIYLLNGTVLDKMYVEHAGERDIPKIVALDRFLTHGPITVDEARVAAGLPPLPSLELSSESGAGFEELLAQIERHREHR